MRVAAGSDRNAERSANRIGGLPGGGRGEHRARPRVVHGAGRRPRADMSGVPQAIRSGGAVERHSPAEAEVAAGAQLHRSLRARTPPAPGRYWPGVEARGAEVKIVVLPVLGAMFNTAHRAARLALLGRWAIDSPFRTTHPARPIQEHCRPAVALLQVSGP
jgi:hypothetical protein